MKEGIKYFGDPFHTNGFGVVAYRQTIKRLGWLFASFSVVSYPIVLTYYSGSALQSNSKFGWSTIGNLGYNSVQCKNSIMAMKMY
jgi:hypothetical protein